MLNAKLKVSGGRRVDAAIEKADLRLRRDERPIHHSSLSIDHSSFLLAEAPTGVCLAEGG